MGAIMGARVTRVGTLVLSVVLVALGVLLPAGPAAAHNSLTGSDPRNGARLGKAPATVRLTFLNKLDPGTTRVTLTGPDNVDAAAGKPVFSGPRVTVPVRPGAAGLYIVRYQVASGDGHPVKGEVRFTLTVGATPTASPSAAVPTPTAPVGSAPAAPPSPAEAEPLSPAADSSGPGWWPWLAGAVLALAALAGAALLRRRASGRRGSAN
ncbi:copper resistance CopC family protein [Plantactinospora sp. BB1]|uniref:copper resistance CopC family protein n=1 Tax=Plantactinospora sp. BB1 TaxID=2071627 RepID=UPI001F261670|nr:copper resistance CopC family protein [Plantactinospora sp. BB1]